MVQLRAAVPMRCRTAAGGTGVPLPQETDGMLDVRGRVVRSSERRLFPRYMKIDDVNSLVADYLAWMPVGTIAEKYGIHRSTATAHLRRREVPTAVAGLDRERRAEALRLYREGLSLREIGRRMGVDRKLVRAALVLRARKSGRVQHEDHHRAPALVLKSHAVSPSRTMLKLALTRENARNRSGPSVERLGPKSG